MSFTYTNGTDIGRVRLQIADTQSVTAVFSDEEIQDFLDLGGSHFAACAMAARSIAMDKAKLERKLQVLDVDLDSKGLAAAYIKIAEGFDQRDNDSAFAVFEMAEGDFAIREKIRKERDRGSD